MKNKEKETTEKEGLGKGLGEGLGEYKGIDPFKGLSLQS